MATLFFRVHATAGNTALGVKLQENVVTVGAVSAQSAVIVGDSRRSRKVRLYSDTDCFVEWGANPTATTDGLAGMPVGADNPEWIDVEAGQRLAVIERV